MKEYTVDDIKEIRIMIPLGTKYFKVPDSGTAEMTAEAKEIILPRIIEAYIEQLNKDGAVPVQFPGFVEILTREEVGLPEMMKWVEPGCRVAVYEGTAVITGDKFPSMQDVTTAEWRKWMEAEDDGT